MTEAANKTGGELSGPGSPLKPGEAHGISPTIPLRRKPDGEFYLQENEFTDIYSPLVGPYAAVIYSALCRKSYGRTDVEHSVRDLANAAGMSPTTAARALQTLQTVGLIRLSPTSGNLKSVCQLLDVKALAASHGAKRERKGAPFALPQSLVDRLKSDLNVLRRNQQGKSKATAFLQGKQNVEIVSRSGFHSLFSVSQRDASVSHLIRQRVTRETQEGTHLIREEVRNEEVPTPTPTPSESNAAPKDKDSADEDEPGGLLKLARAKFTGVMNDLGDHLFDSSRPPARHLANGAVDWKELGFDSLAVKAAAWRGEVLELVLSANDPAAARRGLEKYHHIWNEALGKWFDCDVHVELVQAKPKL